MIEDKNIIGKALKYLNQLLILNLKILENNKLNCEGLISLSKSFSKLTLLQDLSIEILKGNNVGLLGIDTFGKSLKSLSNLSKLSLVIISNPITSEGLESIGKGISIMDCLKDFKIHLINVQMLFLDTHPFLINILSQKLNNIDIKIMIGDKLEDLMANKTNDQLAKLNKLLIISELNFKSQNKRVFIESQDTLIQKIRMLNNNCEIGSNVLLQLNKTKVETISLQDLKIIQNQFQLKIKINEKSKMIGLNNLAYSLHQFSSLKKLIISINPQINIDIGDAIYIKEALAQLIGLYYLKINICNSECMNIEKIDLIIQGIQGCQNLQKFQLLLQGQASIQFLGVLGFLKKLRSFEINSKSNLLNYKRDPLTKDIEYIKVDTVINNMIVDNQAYMHLFYSFKYFQTLKVLDLNLQNLKNNQITLAEKMSESFSFLHNLKQLKIQFSLNVTENILCNIIPGISKANLIQDFSIKFKSQNTSYMKSKITQQFTKDLFKMLAELKKLRKLQINFADEMAQITFTQELIEKMMCVNELDFLSIIIGNAISDGCISAMKYWFQVLNKLTTFHLQINQFCKLNNLTILELVKSFQRMKRIQHLKINVNNQTNTFLEQQLIHDNLFINLKSLNIHSIITINQIPFFKNLSSYFKELQNLEKLILSLVINTNLNSNHIMQLEEGMLSLKSLKHVKIHINTFNTEQEIIIGFQLLVLNMKQLITFSFCLQVHSSKQANIFENLIKRKIIRLVLCN